MGPFISFALFVTVLLAAFKFLKDGTVGQMTMTFFALGHTNACVWTVYSVVLKSKTIFLPTVWSLFASTFALAAYFLVLKKETDAAVAIAQKGHTDTVMTAGVDYHQDCPREMTVIVCSADPTTTGGGDSKDGGAAVVACAACSADTLALSGSASSSGGVCGVSTLGAHTTVTSTVESPTSTTSAGDGTIAHDPTTIIVPRGETSTDAVPQPTNDTPAEILTPQQIADELVARWTYTKKSAAVIFSISAILTTIMIGLCAMGRVEAAMNFSGTMGVIFETVLFMGPLDEISWILKHKNSAPLDAKMLMVGGFNGIVWVLFSILTSDVYVFIPTFAAFILCTFQLGLVALYPSH